MYPKARNKGTYLTVPYDYFTTKMARSDPNGSVRDCQQNRTEP